MKCYFTGEECDCGGHLDTECPHDDMQHDDILEDEGESEYYATERRLADMSHQLERGARAEGDRGRLEAV